MLKTHAIEIKGNDADDLVKALNKLFGGKEEPTEDCTSDAEQPVSSEMKIAQLNRALFDAHVAVGFTEEQALELAKAIIMV